MKVCDNISHFHFSHGLFEFFLSNLFRVANFFVCAIVLDSIGKA